MHMRTYQNCYILFPASVKLALMFCSCMHILLPWLASYSLCHASYLVDHHVMFMCCVFTMLFASFRLCFFSIVPVSLWLWGFIRLRLVHLCGCIFFLDSFFFLAGSQARWSYPRNHYYLCYASLLALCYANATMPTICLSASQIAM